jgi:hypothetical protein
MSLSEIKIIDEFLFFSSVLGRNGLESRQASSLRASVQDALLARGQSSGGTFLDATRVRESHSTPRSAMSETSRRNSAASSSAAAAAAGDSAEQKDQLSRPGKRKRRDQNVDAAVDSSYSLRRRRSRLLPDSTDGEYATLTLDQREEAASQMQDGEAVYESADAANQLLAENEGAAAAAAAAASAGARRNGTGIPIINEPKKRGRRSYRFRAETPVESNLPTPAPGTPANGNDMGTGVNTDQEPTRVIRRLPGRRRAPNPNLSIEADLRRQLTLKTTYRSIVKALKPVLLELTSRSIQQLEDEPEIHKSVPEYDEIVQQLQENLLQRLEQLDAKLKLDLDRNDKELECGRDYAELQFKVGL